MKVFPYEFRLDSFFIVFSEFAYVTAVQPRPHITTIPPNLPEQRPAQREMENENEDEVQTNRNKCRNMIARARVIDWYGSAKQQHMLLIAGKQVRREKGTVWRGVGRSRPRHD